MLEQAIEQFHLAHGAAIQGKTIWLAYSGGLDSHVLLHLYYQLRRIYPITLRAIHINHGLNQSAAEWALHCLAICQQYEIECIQQSVHFTLSPGDSLEEVARKKRYAAFQAIVNKGELLLTAHHEDDQAETLFVQLIRGAGLKGLAAMPILKQRRGFYHGRPLLAFSRKILEQYANTHQLCYIQDDSNENTKLTRNFLRHDILPLLKKRWPNVTSTIARSTRHAAEAQALLEEFAQENIEKMQGSRKNTLSIEQLKKISSAKQRLILRTWIQSQGYILPNEKKIDSIQNNIFTANIDRMPAVTWQTVSVRRYRDDLYILPLQSKHDKTIQYKWDLQTPLLLPSVGLLNAIKTTGKGLCANITDISIRFRQGGEVIYLPERGQCTVKNLFQEWGIAPWLRDRIPFVYYNEELIGLIGYIFNNQYLAKENEIGYEFSL
jgi:tRNA(Ile)-lysidine synthase